MARAGHLLATGPRRDPAAADRRRPREPGIAARPEERKLIVKNPLVALDVLAIQQLLARYCVYLDQREFDTWSTIWAPDGEMHVFGQVWVGPEEITAHISQSDHGLHMAG